MAQLLSLAFAFIATANSVAAQGGNGTKSEGGKGLGKGNGVGGKHGGKANNPDHNTAEVENRRFSRYLFLSLGAVASVIIVLQLVLVARIYVRQIVCINDKNQNYWAAPDSSFLARFKRSFLWAPLFRKRHNREFRISAATNVGTLPTRFQTLLLIGIVVMNTVLCFVSIDWKTKNKVIMLSELRNRSGILSVVNMVPLFVFAGRNNPLIPLLRLSFDTFNLLHRWLGRIVIAEALIHTAAWMASKVIKGGWGAVSKSIGNSQLILQGSIATASFVFIFLQSPSIVRHAFYETFLGIHIVLVIVACITLYSHLAIVKVEDGVDWLLYLQISIALWVCERVFRFANLLYRNVGRTVTTATITALDDACTVILDMPRPWTFKAGQHVYIYFPSLTLWQSHPFTVSWSEETGELNWDEKEGLPKKRQDIAIQKKTKMELLIRRRTGATATIYDKAFYSPGKKITVKALVEGPYGGMHALDSYGTVVLVAGGVGVTYVLPFVRDLVQGHVDGTVATRKVTMIWILQNPEHLQWVKRQMTKVLGMEGRRDILKVLLFISQPRQSREILSPSSTVQMFPGKPGSIHNLIAREVEERIGSVAVTVCGPGSLSDDVREAVRSLSHCASIDFIEESFSW